VKRNAGTPELLDGPIDPSLLAGNLDDLARFNRHGSELSWALLRRLEPSATTVSLLDVGTGGADVPRYLLHQAEASGLDLAVTATDVRPEIVEEAKRRSTGVAKLHIVQATAESLDFADDTFDVVHSSLLMHHLEPQAAVALLREMRRVARRGVIVNDLDRRRPWWLLAQILGLVATRNAYTRNDAPLSVARAYRADEITAMAAAARLREIERLWARPAYRYGLAFVRR
jgi:ubiquinone/menaquinone biosynthesis C-methylase UbiE